MAQFVVCWFIFGPFTKTTFWYRQAIYCDLKVISNFGGEDLPNRKKTVGGSKPEIGCLHASEIPKWDVFFLNPGAAPDGYIYICIYANAYIYVYIHVFICTYSYVYICT